MTRFTYVFKSKWNIKNAGIIGFILLSLIIPTVFVFMFDLSAFYIPESEFRQFYLFSFIYTAVAVLAAYFLMKTSYRTEESRVPQIFRIVLGLLWVVDGVLQFQPEMPYGFLSVVILPAIQAIPSQTVQSFLLIGYNLWKSSPLQFDAMSGALQIFIGSSFLFNRNSKGLRVTAWISVLWILIIWVFGEGFGGIATSGTSLLIGFPGSALIYLMLSVPYLSKKLENRGWLRNYLKYFIFSIFTVGAILQLVPGNTYWTEGQISYTVFQNINIEGEPHVLALLLEIVYKSLLYHEAYINIFLILVMLISGVVVLFQFSKAVYAVFGFTILIWVLFQDMGIYILPSTDPNTGLPLAISILILGEMISITTDKKEQMDNLGISQMDV